MGVRALVSPQAPLYLSSTVPGICTLAGAPGMGAAMVLGARGHGSCLPRGYDLVSYAPACAELVTLIREPHAGSWQGFLHRLILNPPKSLVRD